MMLWQVSRSYVSRTRQHQHTTPQLPCLYVAVYWVLALALSHPLPPPPLLNFFFRFSFAIAPLAQNRSLRLCQSGALTHDGHKP